jgi:hypothetical protein
MEDFFVDNVEDSVCARWKAKAEVIVCDSMLNYFAVTRWKELIAPPIKEELMGMMGNALDAPVLTILRTRTTPEDEEASDNSSTATPSTGGHTSDTGTGPSESGRRSSVASGSMRATPAAQNNSLRGHSSTGYHTEDPAASSRHTAYFTKTPATASSAANSPRERDCCTSVGTDEATVVKKSSSKKRRRLVVNPESSDDVSQKDDATASGSRERDIVNMIENQGADLSRPTARGFSAGSNEGLGGALGSTATGQIPLKLSKAPVGTSTVFGFCSVLTCCLSLQFSLYSREQARNEECFTV